MIQSKLSEWFRNMLFHRFSISSNKECRSLMKVFGGFHMPECFWHRCQRWHFRPAIIRNIFKGQKTMWAACLHLIYQHKAAGWDSLYSRGTYAKTYIFSWRYSHVLHWAIMPCREGYLAPFTQLLLWNSFVPLGQVCIFSQLNC